MIYKYLINIAIVLYKINNSSLTAKAIYKDGVIRVGELRINTRFVYDENIGVKAPCITRKEYLQLLDEAMV